VRALSRIEGVGATVRHALNRLAVVAPAWLRVMSPPEWKDREVRRAEADRLPATHAVRAALALPMGPAGWRWLSAVDPEDAPLWLRAGPAVALRRRGWLQTYGWDGPPRHGREAENLPPAARFISAPDDAEAHDARKPTTPRVGDKGPLTDTCEDDVPHLITNVETTSGPAADGAATPKIHAALQQRSLLPGTHLVDPGCLEAELLVESRDHYGVELLGPTRFDDHWQAREGAGFDAQHFQIDGDQHHATCPAGKTRTGGTPAVDNRGHPVMKVKCSTKDGRRCDQVAQCIRSTKRSPRRTLTIRPQPHYQALQAARPREATDAFQAAYARRAGVEGTSSRGTRRARLRRTRDTGLTRVRRGHILTAVGLNARRLGERFLETARAKTRLTPFARLMADGSAA
jgi:transposase